MSTIHTMEQEENVNGAQNHDIGVPAVRVEVGAAYREGAGVPEVSQPQVEPAKGGLVTMIRTKVAVRRCPGYPAGEPAPCYLICECGWLVAVPEWAFVTIPTKPYSCDCGIEYTGLGFITRRAA